MTSEQLEFLKSIGTDFTILFVEDDDELLKQIIITLEKILPIIITAKDGQEGLELFKSHNNSSTLKNIDLIITDIEMPKKDGLRMITEIKTINPAVPIIITSAYSNTEYFLEAISIGVDNFILKPYTLDEMTFILYKTLKKKYESNLNETIKVCKSIDTQLICIGCNYFYDSFNKLLLKEGIPIKLSKNENALLEILIEAKGQNVPYKTMEYYIWQDLPIQNHSLRSLIYRFRTKTKDDIIETVPSVGYKLPHFVTA